MKIIHTPLVFSANFICKLANVNNLISSNWRLSTHEHRLSKPKSMRGGRVFSITNYFWPKEWQLGTVSNIFGTTGRKNQGIDGQGGVLETHTQVFSVFCTLSLVCKGIDVNCTSGHWRQKREKPGAQRNGWLRSCRFLRGVFIRVWWSDISPTWSPFS